MTNSAYPDQLDLQCLQRQVISGLSRTRVNMSKPTSDFQPIRLLDPSCSYKFKILMTNSADPDQLASSDAS